MRGLYTSILIVLFAFHCSSDALSQDDQKILECLVGTYLNNPVLLRLIEEERYSVKKYSFSKNDCRIRFWWDGAILIEDGKVERIYAGDEEDLYYDIPKSWGIKRLYKDMKRTDKSYPKQPKHEIGNYVYISKQVGDIEASLTYKYRQIDTEYGEKWKMVFTGFVLTAENGNSNCGELPPPPSVYRSILGDRGESLSDWICENFGNPVSNEWLTNHFIPVQMEDDYSRAPYFEEGDYYAHHPIFSGDYYLSFDATVLLRLEDGLLDGIGFYPQLIDRDIFPGINSLTYRSELIEQFGDMDTDYMVDDNEYFLRTPSLEVMFNFRESTPLQFLWINQLFSDGKLDCTKEFPLQDHKEAYCFSGDCYNGFGSLMDTQGRLNTGKWDNGRAVENHDIQYRYGVVKDEYHADASTQIWLNALANEKKEEESKLQERIDNLEEPLEGYVDQLHENGFYYEETEVIMLKDGETRDKYFEIEANSHYGLFFIAESNVVLDVEIFYEGVTEYDQLADTDMAFINTSNYFLEDADGLLTIKLNGDKFGAEYPVKLVIYKRIRY